MADHKKLKGNKRELNGKVDKIEGSNVPGWIKAEDSALQAKRAKDLRRARYQTAQGAIARDIRAKAEAEAQQKQAREENHARILEELGKKK